MKYFLIAVLLFIATANCASGTNQNVFHDREGIFDDNTLAWQEDILWGGNMGLSFSRYVTMISVSPLVGYKVTDNFHPGISGRFMYYNRREGGIFPPFQSIVFGGSVFSRYHITSNFMAIVEYEVLNVSYRDPSTEERTSAWLDAVLAGGGYRSRIGERAHAEIIVLYNFSEDSRYPYNNPIIRFGVSF